MKRATFITWEQLKVGGLILVALGVLTVAIFQLGQAANLFESRYQLVTFLPNVLGLTIGLRLQDRIDPELFRRLVVVVIALSELSLLARAIWR